MSAREFGKLLEVEGLPGSISREAYAAAAVQELLVGSVEWQVRAGCVAVFAFIVEQNAHC